MTLIRCGVVKRVNLNNVKHSERAKTESRKLPQKNRKSMINEGGMDLSDPMRSSSAKLIFIEVHQNINKARHLGVGSREPLPTALVSAL